MGDSFPQIAPSRGGMGTPILFMIPWGRPSPQSKLHHNQFGYFRIGDRRVFLNFTMGAPFPQNCPFPWGIWTACKTRFLGPIRAHNANSISISRAVFPQTTVECPYTLQWDAHSPPKICPFPWGDLNSHLILGPLGPPKSSTQTASWSVQPFLQGSLVWQTNINDLIITGHRNITQQFASASRVHIPSCTWYYCHRRLMLRLQCPCREYGCPYHNQQKE